MYSSPKIEEDGLAQLLQPRDVAGPQRSCAGNVTRKEGGKLVLLSPSGVIRIGDGGVGNMNAPRAEGPVHNKNNSLSLCALHDLSFVYRASRSKSKHMVTTTAALITFTCLQHFHSLLQGIVDVKQLGVF